MLSPSTPVDPFMLGFSSPFKC